MTKKLIKAFAGYTTFHGLGFIVLPGSSLRRRLIWMCLFTLCMSLMMYQAVDRVTYFHSHPVTVNYRTIYNSSLRFPAVTICNQNKHKASNAEELGMYDLLKKINSKSANTSMLKPEHENITWEEVQLKTAHRKEDMIQRCRFGEEKCTYEDFNTTVTDHGICYTFNKDIRDERIVSLPGTKHGLHLTLNAEEYEYMPGTYDSVGVMMLMHRQGEVPLVRLFGQALVVDEFISIGLKKTIAKNLPKPYGDCENKQLQFFEKYTPNNCHNECRTKRAIERCGCRLPFMHGTDEFSRPCTLRDYVTCMRETVADLESEQCDCPMPCYQEMYEPETFDSPISELALTEIVTTIGQDKLQSDLRKGEESLYRMEDKVWHSLVDSYKSALGIFIEYLQIAKQDISLFEQKLHNLSKATSINKFGLIQIQETLDKTRKTTEDLSKNISPFVKATFSRTMEKRIRRLMSKENQEILYDIILDTLSTSNDTIYHHKTIFNVFASAKAIEGILDTNMEKLLEQLDVFGELAEEAYHNRTVNESTLVVTRQKYQKYVDDIKATILKLDGIISSSDQGFINEMTAFEANNALIETNVHHFNSIKNDLDTINKTVKNLNSLLKDLLKSAGKTDIVELMISKRVHRLRFYLNKLTQIGNLNERVIHTRELMRTQARNGAMLCKRIYFLERQIGQYDKHRLRMCMNLHQQIFNGLQNKQTDDYAVILLQDAFKELIKSSEDFNDSIQINNIFIRKNFLQVDIYFRTMGYEAVNQQEGYSFFALMCDIGGSMGLLIGGSVLSLFEIVDLIIRQAYFKRKKHLEELERRKTQDNRHW